MKASLISKTVKTPMGSEFQIGVRPYNSNRVAIARRQLYKLLEEDGYNLDDGMYNGDYWFFVIMSKVLEVEFPDEQMDDIELLGFRDFWENQNGDFRHNHELCSDVSEAVLKAINNAVEEAEDEYKSRLPQQPAIIKAGKPSVKDPKDGKPGLKQPKKG
jgi:hypothetical protein